MAHWFHGGAGPNSPFSSLKLAWRSLLWRYPSLGHRTLNNVPLDPFAFWAGSLGPTRSAQSLSTSLENRKPCTADLGFVCRAWLPPSVRSPEFPGKPSYESRLHRVARNDFVLYEVATRTLEPSMLKAHGTRTNARQHHARRAVRTVRALDACERWTGEKICFWHDTSLHLGGSVQHSQSPIGADTGR